MLIFSIKEFDTVNYLTNLRLLGPVFPQQINLPLL